MARAQRADTQPEQLHPIVGSAVAAQVKRREDAKAPPRGSTPEVRAIVEKALKGGLGLEMIYHSLKDDSRRQMLVIPERIALNREGASVLVALDLESGNRLTYAILQIERARTTEQKAGGGP